MDDGSPPVKLAVCASSGGSNFEALMNSEIAGMITLLYCENSTAPVVARARARGVNVVTGSDLPSVLPLEIDRIVLAGYMRILPEAFVRQWSGRIVNIHPSLLPAFPGLRAIERALAFGVRWTGVTIHEVVHAVDAGPILRQEPVPVEPSDDVERLRRRIQEIEHRIYAPTIAEWLTNPKS